MKEKDIIMALGRKLEAEEDAGFDLWTWLPSYKAAKANHGDYASEFRPSTENLLKEAAMYLAFLNGHDKENEQNAGWFECPCGECEKPKTCNNCDIYADTLMRCRAVEGAPSCFCQKPHDRCPFIRGNKGLVEKL